MSHTSISRFYPSPWLVPVNPAHEEARRDTVRWIRGLGLLEDIAMQRKLDAMHVGWYGGSPFPSARLPELTTITRFLTLWILHDDILEGLGADAPALLGAAVRGEPAACPDHDPYLRGWWELGRRFRATMSDAWLSRLSMRFVEWLASVEAEARLAKRMACGESPSFEEYMAVREVNIGVLPTACWIEYALGRELPAAMLVDPDLALAERAACRLVTHLNDRIGLEKDVRRGWPNAVLSLARDGHLSMKEAIGKIEELHCHEVTSLAAAGERLAQRHGEAAREWTLHLGRMVAGFARWHLNAPRYAASLSIEGSLTRAAA